ncbi:TetR/AcrR family transcriptional regulator [Gordonia sp. ABSL11-1]|uniref:TetR/AcrR family transcriptional regulator n=1 Tax=Gordonia sp. ABSL11-1 TaxID=3053924 RepID=UPI00257249CC|nr:TetR/AcrR family transcriptional regulator [Gordonia sp. ABSL11-1]MDL9947364.1 TetR/AcrR family transcriptional regulator [Gordonia sp. ABSL11-1]
MARERDADLTERSPRNRRPGGRSARVRRDVLDATVQHVFDRGLEGLTIAAVAKSAGVAETTVYRRWPTPPALIADAMGDLAELRNPIPDTGDVRTDLRQLLEQVVVLVSEPALGRLLGATLALSADQDVRAARERFWRLRFVAGSEIVDNAVRRGAMIATVDPRTIIETLVAPVYFRVTVTGGMIDDDFLQRCVDDVLILYGTSDP